RGSLQSVIDLRALREDPERLRASQRTRGEDPSIADRLLELDAGHRSALTRFETLRAEQKSVGRSVSKAPSEEREELLAKAKSLSAEVKEAEAEAGDRKSTRLNSSHVSISYAV